MKIAIILGLIIAIALALFMFQKTKKKSVESDPLPTPLEPAPVKRGKIYGTMTCRYTVKQIEKYPEYEFTDCSGGGCPSFVSAFPTTEHPDGSVIVGYM
jgi:hypothetical protein